MTDIFKVSLSVILAFGGLATATVSIDKFCKLDILKPLRKYITKDVNKKNSEDNQFIINALEQIKLDNKELHQKIDSVDASVLKTIICSTEMPITEKLLAGDKYVNYYHLNGEVKAKYKAIQEKFIEDEKAKI